MRQLHAGMRQLHAEMRQLHAEMRQLHAKNASVTRQIKKNASATL